MLMLVVIVILLYILNTTNSAGENVHNDSKKVKVTFLYLKKRYKRKKTYVVLETINSA